MNYTKPETIVLGQIVDLIEQLVPPKVGGSTEPFGTENPAYEIDE